MSLVDEKKASSYLLFGVHVNDNNLFSAKIVKVNKDGKISEWKKGSATSLGHALTIAGDLMGAYALQVIEVSPEQFYDDVRII